LEELQYIRNHDAITLEDEIAIIKSLKIKIEKRKKSIA
jgi:hypothetical protein